MRVKGITLIELIIGIVVFAIALTIVTTLIASQSRQSVDPIWQVKAVELGQSLLNEISAKSFDEQSDRVGGIERCNESLACTNSATLGPDNGENRANYDDIDDYHGFDAQDAGITNSISQSLESNGQAFYQGFRAQVNVFYDDNLDGINDADTNNDGVLETGTLVGNRKLIRVVITTPSGNAIPLTLYRFNH